MTPNLARFVQVLDQVQAAQAEKKPLGSLRVDMEKAVDALEPGSEIDKALELVFALFRIPGESRT